jgi:hypothetical protein
MRAGHHFIDEMLADIIEREAVRLPNLGIEGKEKPARIAFA